jgi:hypothetical protein
MSTMNNKKGWKQRILNEFLSYWIIVLYMAIFFGVFTTYRRLLLAHYQIDYAEYGVSVIRALVLAKVVLVAETLRLGRGFEDKPLVVPTLYKTLLFTICVVLFSGGEELVRSFIHGKGLTAAVDDVMSQLDFERLAKALVVFFAFIPFFMVRELGRVLGKGAIARLFFQRRSAVEAGTDPKLKRLESDDGRQEETNP